jgi:hypothetical protein
MKIYLDSLKIKELQKIIVYLGITTNSKSKKDYM